MLAENEYGWQTIRKNTKRIDIWRDWQFKTMRSGSGWFYPEFYTSCIYTIPNETSVITIQTLTSDNDGFGLNYDDCIIFKIRCALTAGANYYTLINVYLKNKKRYKIIDGEGVKYVFLINFGYYLSNIPNYKDIRAFTLMINQTCGINKGNETSVMVNYTQDIF